MTIDAYGGSLTENVIQALARDLLVWAMFKCRKAEGLPIHPHGVTVRSSGWSCSTSGDAGPPRAGR